MGVTASNVKIVRVWYFVEIHELQAELGMFEAGVSLILGLSVVCVESINFLIVPESVWENVESSFCKSWMTSSGYVVVVLLVCGLP